MLQKLKIISPAVLFYAAAVFFISACSPDKDQKTTTPDRHQASLK